MSVKNLETVVDLERIRIIVWLLESMRLTSVDVLERATALEALARLQRNLESRP